MSGGKAMELPSVKVDYLKSFTDDTGIFQHARYCIPKRSEGYTTDDNARALIACIRYYRLKTDPQMKSLANVYLAFLNHMQKTDGNFHNYLGYERSFLDVEGQDDCMGRTLWSCGSTINSTLPKDMKLAAKEIFDRALPWVWKTTSLRIYAHTIMGLYQYFQAVPDNNLVLNTEKLADKLLQHYKEEVKHDWHWFEPHLTYDNARLPQALFIAYEMVGNQKYLDAAVESLDFLLKTQMVENVFVPIGNNGWYKRGENRATYDQQPLEAAATVEAAIEAFHVTKEKRYAEIANTVFGWFLGKNSLKVMVYNPETAGCYDGITAEEVNLNQGAESSICYLLARLRLEELKPEFRRQKRGA
jgi:hypothetical protein